MYRDEIMIDAHSVYAIAKWEKKRIRPFHTVCSMKNDINAVFIIPIFFLLLLLLLKSSAFMCNAHVCVRYVCASVILWYIAMDAVIWNMKYCLVSIGFQPFSGMTMPFAPFHLKQSAFGKHTHTNLIFLSLWILQSCKIYYGTNFIHGKLFEVWACELGTSRQ